MKHCISVSSALFLLVASTAKGMTADKADFIRSLRENGGVRNILQKRRGLQSISCLNAYNDLHDRNRQFRQFFDDVVDAFGDCTNLCSVDGKSVVGTTRFNQLVQDCRDIDGATPYLEEIEFDCAGDADFTFSNLLDCLPRQCSHSDNAAIVENTEQRLEGDLAVYSCNVDWTSRPLAANDDSAGSFAGEWKAISVLLASTIAASLALL